MPLQGQASFSTATTAVASQSTAYPSLEEFAMFKNPPPKPEIMEPMCDSASEKPDQEHKLDPRPVTPNPPSPISTDSSDDKIADDTPSTIHGESMIFPRHPLSNRKHAANVPTTPRWPFQDATPRVMVPITRSVTSSSSPFNLGSKKSPPGKVSVSESLDEFQLNHPNARLLELHPPQLAYNETTRNLANVPELVEKPLHQAQSAETITEVNKKHFNPFRGGRWNPRSPKANVGQPDEKLDSIAKPTTVWYQRLSLQKDAFRGSAAITLFLIANTFISISSLVTLTVADVAAPPALIVWVIVSVTTSAFASTIILLMIRYRRAVAFDEENRFRSYQPKVFSESDVHLPASPREVAHRQKLGSAPVQGHQFEQTVHPSEKTGSVPEMGQVTYEVPMDTEADQMDDFAFDDRNIIDTVPRHVSDEEQIESYWADVPLTSRPMCAKCHIEALKATVTQTPTDSPQSNS
ncbi:uncharacterized protein CTRU02_210780 [Colletotrichum truncatum]|uniref:Uncharacterized protein n=1 Tax=Colletotrichum truncatum TaxID=5467 RepID=A0ACC3YR95_COLTU|nr:uncharacterized protein CTRU02_03733 [Colletotrichum truncatum]KAF6796755.1 hypothetical protein CTRU02_03733 [Colletotrichum truncatum]